MLEYEAIAEDGSGRNEVGKYDGCELLRKEVLRFTVVSSVPRILAAKDAALIAPHDVVDEGSNHQRQPELSEDLALCPPLRQQDLSEHCLHLAILVHLHLTATVCCTIRSCILIQLPRVSAAALLKIISVRIRFSGWLCVHMRSNGIQNCLKLIICRWLCLKNDLN